MGRTALDALRGRADAASRELAVDTLLAGATFENIDSDEFEQLPDVHPLVLLFGYAPVLLTLGPAAIAAKAIIWLTVFAHGPLRVGAVADPPEAGGRDRDSAHPLSGRAGRRRTGPSPAST